MSQFRCRVVFGRVFFHGAYADFWPVDLPHLGQVSLFVPSDKDEITGSYLLAGVASRIGLYYLGEWLLSEQRDVLANS